MPGVLVDPEAAGPRDPVEQAREAAAAGLVAGSLTSLFPQAPSVQLSLTLLERPALQASEVLPQARMEQALLPELTPHSGPSLSPRLEIMAAKAARQGPGPPEHAMHMDLPLLTPAAERAQQELGVLVQPLPRRNTAFLWQEGVAAALTLPRHREPAGAEGLGA